MLQTRRPAAQEGAAGGHRSNGRRLRPAAATGDAGAVPAPEQGLRHLAVGEQGRFQRRLEPREEVPAEGLAAGGATVGGGAGRKRSRRWGRRREEQAAGGGPSTEDKPSGAAAGG